MWTQGQCSSSIKQDSIYLGPVGHFDPVLFLTLVLGPWIQTISLLGDFLLGENNWILCPCYIDPGKCAHLKCYCHGRSFCLVISCFICVMFRFSFPPFVLFPALLRSSLVLYLIIRPCLFKPVFFSYSLPVCQLLSCISWILALFPDLCFSYS